MNKKKYLVFFAIFLFGLTASMRLKPIVGILFASLIPLFVISGKRKARFIFAAFCVLLLFAIIFGAKAKLLVDDKVYTYLQGNQLGNVARNVLYSTSFRIAGDFSRLVPAWGLSAAG